MTSILKATNTSTHTPVHEVEAGECAEGGQRRDAFISKLPAAGQVGHAGWTGEEEDQWTKPRWRDACATRVANRAGAHASCRAPSHAAHLAAFGSPGKLQLQFFQAVRSEATIANPAVLNYRSPGKLQLQLFQPPQRGQVGHTCIRHLAHALQECKQKGAFE